MRQPSRWVLFGASLTLLLTALALGMGSAGAAPERDATTREPLVLRPKVPTRERLLEGFDPRRRALEGDHFVSALQDGYDAVLTVDPELDQFLERLLARYEVPFGAVVAVEPATGRLLAYVSHSSASGSAVDRVLDASPPAASVFKVVTSAALLESGLAPDTTTCYHGGFSSLGRSELADKPKLDTACV